ncbi:hypothetical protein FAI41_03090 [Acetobacteraceae bacterium]|nr:hypothetical protein FAI41_03090 [Acetobacteraceae bacterium]
MELSDVFDEFEEWDRFPDLEDIRSFLESNLSNNYFEIEFLNKKKKTEILKDLGRTKDIKLLAFLHQEELTTAFDDEKVLNYIFCDETLSVEQKRLSCTKELLHILDSVASRTGAENDVKELFIELHSHVNTEKKANLSPKPLHVIQDAIGIIPALLVLFPFKLREKIVPKIKEKVLTIDDVCKVVRLPKEWVVLILSDVWPFLRAALKIYLNPDNKTEV